MSNSIFSVSPGQALDICNSETQIYQRHARYQCLAGLPKTRAMSSLVNFVLLPRSFEGVLCFNRPRFNLLSKFCLHIPLADGGLEHTSTPYWCCQSDMQGRWPAG